MTRRRVSLNASRSRHQPMRELAGADKLVFDEAQGTAVVLQYFVD
jgi:hypothetical protein